jgi:RNA polymerase sigma factor (TIGR02999 family)
VSIPVKEGGRNSEKPTRLRKVFDHGKKGFQNSVMSAEPQNEVTLLLKEWAAGDPKALEQLVPLVQRELHRLASLYMSGERENHQLQTTALINEAYIRLLGWKNVEWRNRGHFFGVAAQMMRRILVDAARANQGSKPFGFAFETPLDEALLPQPERSPDLVALDDALTRLGELDPRKSEVVELRFFCGLSLQEIAAVLEVSDRTVLREWNLARAWLYRELKR